MGKRRKSAKKVASKKKVTLPKLFTCPFCDHVDSCAVKFDFEERVGTITCKECGKAHKTVIHALSDAVDVYVDWIDGLEKVNS